MSERDSGRINADNLLLHPNVKELESTLEKAAKLETQLAETQAKLDRAIAIIKEADWYLDYDKTTTIRTISPIHNGFKDFLNEIEEAGE